MRIARLGFYSDILALWKVGDDMKSIMQKCYEQLKPSEKERIEMAIFDRLDEELCSAQFVWIKMACAVLNKVGLTTEQITQFLGGWKMMYRRNSRFKSKDEQTEFVEKEMAQIFGDGGFPEEFMQSFKEIGRS